MRNKAKKLIVFLGFIMLFCIFTGCDKKTETEKVDKADLNPELQDTISIVQEHSYPNYSTLALKENGNVVTLYDDNQEYSAAFSENSLYILHGSDDKHVIGYIDLTRGDEDYHYENIGYIDHSIYGNIGMAVVKNYLFYSYSVREYDANSYFNYIGRYDLSNGENDMQYKKFGMHEISGILGYKENLLIYSEKSGSKNIIRSLDVDTGNEEVITEYGVIHFVNGDKLIYGEEKRYDFIDVYEYDKEGNHKFIVNCKFEDYKSILPYEQGYLYLSDSVLFYCDGNESRELIDLRQKDKVENYFTLISKNKVRFFTDYSSYIFYEYDLITGGLDTIDIEYELTQVDNQEPRFSMNAYDYTIYYFND